MDYRVILGSVDEDENVEHPRGYDWEEHRRLALRLRALLSDFYGRVLTLEDFVQDASFGFDIELETRDSPGARRVRSNVRLSNFGNLATIIEPGLVPDSVLPNIEAIIHEAGFTFVPIEILDRKYDGCAPKEWGIQSWWQRFFEYQ